jgi:hypothetical protein
MKANWIISHIYPLCKIFKALVANLLTFFPPSFRKLLVDVCNSLIFLIFKSHYLIRDKGKNYEGLSIERLAAFLFFREAFTIFLQPGILLRRLPHLSDTLENGGPDTWFWKAGYHVKDPINRKKDPDFFRFLAPSRRP